jgi:hypothetical protein
MSNFEQIEQDWMPVCINNLFEIPTDHPLVFMEHKRTKEHAYFDIKLDRFLSQQEAFDSISGNHWSALTG